ncbi:MAG: uroporphyrinogen decarboxylase family protein [Dehalococcoidales bacterium]
MNGERPVFIPFVYGFAAKIEQITLEEMVSDAGYYTHSLEDVYDLFKYGGVVNNFDSTIEAEIFGCEIEWSDDYAAPRVADCSQVVWQEVNPEESHRTRVLLETTKRLVVSRGKDLAIIGVVTGPVSLVQILTGDGSGNIAAAIPLAGNLLRKMVKSFCELRVDAVFFREDIIGTGYHDALLAHPAPYTAVYTTLFNLVRHYNNYPVLITRNFNLDSITDLHRMIGFTGLVLLGNKLDDDAMVFLQELSASLKISLGLPLPVQNQDELNDRFAVISRSINNNKPTGFFYVSDGEIPGNMPAEALHNLLARMHDT